MAAESLREVLGRVANWEHHHTPAIPPPVRQELKNFEERAADRITAFAGSMRFVYLHTAWFLVWIAINLGLITAVVGGLLAPFDPFPFGLLTMIVSLEAIFLSTFVMISQNRQAAVADRRAELDYQVTLKTEAEVCKIIVLLEALVSHHAELVEPVSAELEQRPAAR